MTGPTQTLVGTEARVAVYERRHEAGLPIFCSEDSRKVADRPVGHGYYIRRKYQYFNCKKNYLTEYGGDDAGTITEDGTENSDW